MISHDVVLPCHPARRGCAPPGHFLLLSGPEALSMAMERAQRNGRRAGGQGRGVPANGRKRCVACCLVDHIPCGIDRSSKASVPASMVAHVPLGPHVLVRNVIHAARSRSVPVNHTTPSRQHVEARQHPHVRNNTPDGRALRAPYPLASAPAACATHAIGAWQEPTSSMS
jgi:hypothetical protein